MNAHREETQERWLAGDPDVEFGPFEREVITDAALADEIYAALELDKALQEAAGQDVASGRSVMRRPWVWSGAAVAALLAFFLIMPEFQQPGQHVPLRLRGAGDAGAAVCTHPLGELDHFPRTFTWQPATSGSGTRYRWELYDAQTHRRGIAVVADTTLFRDAGLAPADSFGAWLWLVVELKANGLEGPTSAAVQFTVKPKDKK